MNICIGSGQRTKRRVRFIVCAHCLKMVSVSKNRVIHTHVLPPHLQNNELLRKS